MHDPMTVAFEIRRPWPKRSGVAKAGGPRWEWVIYRKHAKDHPGRNPRQWWKPSAWSPFVTAFGRRWYFPSILTVWHVEPKGRDSGTVCPHYVRWRDHTGKWRSKPLNGWRWHVHHWHLQVPPLQDLQRRLFQRCEWCGGRSTKAAPVNVSHQWDAPKNRPWWSSKPGLFHMGCSSAPHVLRSCLCDVPIVERFNGAFGTCATCGKSYRSEASWIGYREAVAISGVPVTGQRWTWPREVNCHDIEERLKAERAVMAAPNPNPPPPT